RTVRRIAAADVQKKADRERRILLVGEIMLISAFNVADVFLWPVALFANRLGWSRIRCAHENGPIEIAQGCVIKLLYAVQFGFEIRGRPRSNVTINTVDFGMRGMLSSNELRLHRKMTRLAAKLDRFGQMISLITADGAEEKKSGTDRSEHPENFSVACAREIDFEDNRLCSLERSTIFAPLQNRPE